MHERSTSISHAFHVSLADARTPDLICFSHLRWDFVWQRPHHLLSRAARHYRVLFIEEPVFRPDATPCMEVTMWPQGVTVAVPVLPEGTGPSDAILEQRDLAERLIGRSARIPRVFWYFTPTAIAFTSHLEADLVVYDNMDELSLFRGASRELLNLESTLFARADLVFTGGMSLYEAKRKRHPAVHAFPSSIDVEHFARARATRRDPPDQETLAHPRLGFFGVIDERMDVDLVGEVAAMRPNWQFVMIGPVVKIDAATLPRRPNVHWLGGKSYTDLPDYLSGWSVGLMPFALNEATRFISPTKTPEFLAAGVPVVSTPITDVVRPYGERGLIEIAETPHEVIRKAEMLLQRPKERWLQKVDRHLAAGSWDKTFASMQTLIADRLDGATTQSGPGLSAYLTRPAE
jgi:glycosyltransferase involved in cell wall biosynthesis